MDDKELICKTLNGDDRSFEELVHRYRGHVMKIVYRYARDSHEVDEMAQDTFIKTYFSLKTYRFTAPFHHWLSRIATNVALDHLRKRYRRRETLLSEIENVSSERLENILSRLSDSKQADPILQKEANEVLEYVLTQLSPKEQWLIKTVEIENSSLKEIEERTGWGVSLIKVRLFRARKKMKKVLEKMFIERRIK